MSASAKIHTNSKAPIQLKTAKIPDSSAATSSHLVPGSGGTATSSHSIPGSAHFLAGATATNHTNHNLSDRSSDANPSRIPSSHEPKTQVTAPLFRKMDQSSHENFSGGQYHNGNNSRGGFVPNGQRRGGEAIQAFPSRHGNQNQPAGQRSWVGRSSGDGSLFGGAVGGKRKMMSEGMN